MTVEGREQLLEILKTLLTDEGSNESVIGETLHVVPEKHGYLVESQLVQFPKAGDEFEEVQIVDERLYELI